MAKNYSFVYAKDTRLLSEQLISTGCMLASFIPDIQLIITNFFGALFGRKLVLQTYCLSSLGPLHKILKLVWKDYIITMYNQEKKYAEALKIFNETNLQKNDFHENRVAYRDNKHF